jgi:hypothetical protein
MAKAKVLTKDEIKRVMRIADTGNNGLRDRVALSLSVCKRPACDVNEANDGQALFCA